MPSLRELGRYAAEDTLRTAEKIDLGQLRGETKERLAAELNSLGSLWRSEADSEAIFIILDRIRRLSTDELIRREDRQGSTWHWLYILSRRTSDQVLNMVLHPDYKPPRGHP
jgi:hypothetical protein